MRRRAVHPALIGPPLSYEHAMRILLTGTCGANAMEVERAGGVGHVTVAHFIAGRSVRPAMLEKLGWFIWRKLNAHQLIAAEDRQTPEPQETIVRFPGGDVRFPAGVTRLTAEAAGTPAESGVGPRW